MRSQPPLGGGEPRPVPTPCKPGPGIMAWKHMEAVVGEPGAPITHCRCRSHFSLEVKLNSSSGLLFYVAGERGSSMALFVSSGRFVFLVDVGRRRLRLRSKDKYRDRRWHTVSRAQQDLPEPHQHPCRGWLSADLLWAVLLHCTWDTAVPGEQRGQRNHSRDWLSL